MNTQMESLTDDEDSTHATDQEYDSSEAKVSMIHTSKTARLT